jgi:hypothetical protein
MDGAGIGVIGKTSSGGLKGPELPRMNLALNEEAKTGKMIVYYLQRNYMLSFVVKLKRSPQSETHATDIEGPTLLRKP